MKKILFISLALCCTIAAFGQNGKYTAIKRTYDFLKELNNEQEYQRGGNL